MHGKMISWLIVKRMVSDCKRFARIANRVSWLLLQRPLLSLCEASGYTRREISVFYLLFFAYIAPSSLLRACCGRLSLVVGSFRVLLGRLVFP